MIHFLSRGTHGKVGVAVFEDGPNFSLRIRGHNVKQNMTKDVYGTIPWGWRVQIWGQVWFNGGYKGAFSGKIEGMILDK